MPSRQRYSHYLPLKRWSRAASRSASLNKDAPRSPTREKETRNGRASSSSQTSKRRSTMNSREAGYDEAEALRRAIEASKEEVHTDLPDSGSTRRAKRGRSDSEEYGSHYINRSEYSLIFFQEAGKRQTTKNKFAIRVPFSRQTCRRFRRRWSPSERDIEIEIAKRRVTQSSG